MFDRGDLIATGIAIFSVIWAISTFLATRRDARERTAFSLHEFYNKSEMVSARARAWDFVSSRSRERPVRYSSWWADPDPACQSGLNDLEQVLAFWHRVYAADLEGKLDRPASRRLLGYYYAHWRAKLRPLAEDTRDHDADFESALEAFLDKRLNWLARGARIAEPNVDGGGLA